MRSHPFLLLLLPLALAVVGVQPSPSRAQGADDGTWSTILPPETSSRTFAFDPTRRRTLHFSWPWGGNWEIWFQDADRGSWTRVPIRPATTIPGPIMIIYDPGADRFVLWSAGQGGRVELWAIDAGSPIEWRRLPEIDAAPSNRDGFSLVRDSRRDRWILFGGDLASSNQMTNELWDLRLGDSSARWTRLETVGEPIVPRSSAGAAYDSTGDRMLFIGGGYAVPSGGVMATSDRVDELRLGSLPEWRALGTAGPRPDGHNATCLVDESRNRLIHFESPRDTVRALRLQDGTWELLSARPFTAGVYPSTRGAAIDPTADQLIAWTGSTTADRGSIWHIPLELPRFDPEFATPGDSSLPSVAFVTDVHPDTNTPLLLQAWVRALPRVTDGTVWLLDDRVPGRWRPLVVDGIRPDQFVAQGSAMDTRRGRWILLYGLSSSGDSTLAQERQIWSIELRPTPRWRRLETRGSGPPPLDHCGVTYDPVSDRLLVAPGRTGATVEGAASIWSLRFDADNTWDEIRPVGRPPRSRNDPRLAFDPRRNRLAFHGGLNPLGGVALSGSAGYQYDLWTVDFTEPARWDSIAIVGDSLRATDNFGFSFDPGRGTFLVAGNWNPAKLRLFGSIGFQMWELSPSDSSWISRRMLAHGEPGMLGRSRGLHATATDRLFAFSPDPDLTIVFDRSRPSRLVPAAVDLAPGSSPAQAASARGPDVAAALLTGWDFDPFVSTIVEVALDGIRGDPLAGGRARRDADGDGRGDVWFAFKRAELGLVAGERTFELRAHTSDGVTLVGFAAAKVSDRPGAGSATNTDDAGASSLAFGVQLDTPLRAGGGLRLTLPGERVVTIEVFAVDGRRMASAAPTRYEAGHHRVALPAAARLAPGVYWARVRAGSDVWTGRVVRVE